MAEFPTIKRAIEAKVWTDEEIVTFGKTTSLRLLGERIGGNEQAKFCNARLLEERRSRAAWARAIDKEIDELKKKCTISYAAQDWLKEIQKELLAQAEVDEGK